MDVDFGACAEHFKFLLQNFVSIYIIQSETCSKLIHELNFLKSMSEKDLQH